MHHLILVVVNLPAADHHIGIVGICIDPTGDLLRCAGPIILVGRYGVVAKNLVTKSISSA